MHLPYIYKVFGEGISIIPIMAGITSPQRAEDYGKILAPYFDR